MTTSPPPPEPAPPAGHAIAPTADVSSDATIGANVLIWHLAQVREHAQIGANCIVGRGAYIGTGVHVGDNCKIQNYALVYEPAHVADGVFIGPAAVLTNDQFPRAVNPDLTPKSAHDWTPVGVTVLEGASIGARAVCVAPVTIGRWSLVAAGSTVIRDVQDFALVAGTPAKRVGWVGRAGQPLQPTPNEPDDWTCPVTGARYRQTTPDLLEENARVIPAAKPIIGDEERAAVDRVLASGGIAQGPEVAAFEQEFGDAMVAGHECVAVNSGTSALHMALIALGIKQGDEVIVPSFTFAATANAVALAGATPVFADIDPATFCLDSAAAGAAITPRTRAIMPVHLYGHPAAMDQFSALAAKHDLLIIEDAAQAHGATLHGIPVGALGDAGCFSFYPTKNMTSGEGGMVTTASSETARTVRLLRNQGMEQRYRNEIVGFNTRMTDIHAAIGRVQVQKLPEWTRERQQNAAFLSENLENVVTPTTAVGATHVFHQYTIRIPDHDQDTFAAALAERGVGSGVYYPIPVHALPSFGLHLDLPETARAASEVVSLPVHPSLDQADLDTIVEAVNAVAKAGA